MKKLSLLLVALTTAFSCQSKDNPTAPEKVDLSISPETVEAPASEGVYTVIAKCSVKPYIVGQSDWCEVSASAVKDNSSELTVKVSANDSYQPRSVQFSIVCDEQKKYLKVNQAAAVEDLSFLDTPSLKDNNAVAVSRSLGYGWNLGNQMDAVNNGVSGETFWGNPKCTQVTIEGLKAKGFSTVRIPVTWMGHIGEAPDYAVEAAWLDRVAEIAGYAKSAGLNAIVNIHHDGSPTDGWLCVHKAAKDAAYKDEMLARYKSLWKQIARKFADEGNWLIFEAYNELQDGNWGWGDNRTDGGKQYAVINELAQAFVTTVRSTGGNNADRYLAVLGYTADPTLTVNNLTLPEDSAKDRLIVSLHFYDPSEYALGQNSAYTEWGHTGTDGKKDPNHSEKNVIDTFKMLKEKYLDNNIPVYVGECGAVNRPDDRAKSFQQYWFEFVFKAAKEYGLCPVVWDNGAKSTGNESFGFIDHSNGNYINDSKPVIDMMEKAFDTADQAYTLRSVYDNAPR
ncbi:MAG: cellulase family glycosylhydrolase [Candidatus Cryptobacteroides sp.]